MSWKTLIEPKRHLGMFPCFYYTFNIFRTLFLKYFFGETSRFKSALLLNTKVSCSKQENAACHFLTLWAKFLSGLTYYWFWAKCEIETWHILQDRLIGLILFFLEFFKKGLKNIKRGFVRAPNWLGFYWYFVSFWMTRTFPLISKLLPGNSFFDNTKP